MYLALAYRQLGDTEGLGRTVDHLLQIAPEHLPGHLMLAELRRLQGDLEGSLAALERAVELDPRNRSTRPRRRARVGVGRGPPDQRRGSREWRRRWAKKGRVQVGADAELTIFDPERIRDRATYEQADQTSEGICPRAGRRLLRGAGRGAGGGGPPRTTGAGELGDGH